jgi:hypothetical protein
MSSKIIPTDDEDIVMAFKHIGIAQVNPPHLILSNVSGFIKRGGITAGISYSICLFACMALAANFSGGAGTKEHVSFL